MTTKKLNFAAVDSRIMRVRLTEKPFIIEGIGKSFKFFYDESNLFGWRTLNSYGYPLGKSHFLHFHDMAENFIYNMKVLGWDIPSRRRRETRRSCIIRLMQEGGLV